MIIYLKLCLNLCKLNESFKKTDPDLLHCQDYSSGYNSSFSATIFSPPHNHLLLTSSSPPPDHLLTSSSPPPDHLLAITLLQCALYGGGEQVMGCPSLPFLPSLPLHLPPGRW